MSCPNWSRLVAHRYAGAREREPDGWREALAHLDSCSACREAAYAADPTLVLRRHEDVRLDGDELSRMRAGVEAIRRARRVEEGSPVGRVHRGAGTDSRLSRWSALAPDVVRVAAAAGLAAVLLSVHPHSGRAGGDRLPAAAAVSELEALIASPAAGSWGEDLGDLAATDDFYRTTATVVHIDDDDLDVVLLVDSELDV